jgi:hypothetical protein
MTQPPLNQPPLFCRSCMTSYEDITEDGKCTKCGTHNIYQPFHIPVELTVNAYSYEEAKSKIMELVNALSIPMTDNDAD